MHCAGAAVTWLGTPETVARTGVATTVNDRLNHLFPPNGTAGDDALQITLDPDAGRASPWLSCADHTMLRRQPQGYVIVADPAARTLSLAGGSMIGLLYAVVTLRQLVVHDGGAAVVPAVVIHDFPDFRLRGLDWLLNAEANRWGYDWGDGRAAVRRRLCRRLELCLDDKINMVQFDGFGWDWGRDEEFDALRREINACARDRGIHLIYGGYGGGYGASYQTQFARQGALRGRVFHNRHTYPDGDTYPCQGAAFYQLDDPRRDRSRHLGTCLANPDLRRLKLDDLQAFVRAVEPGALYIHDLDAGDWGNTETAWQLRCDRCRDRHPDDRLDAGDGHAGAYAEWFRAVHAAVADVHTAGGYRGSDCLLIFVGPLYTSVRDSDAVWNAERRYFKILSNLLPIAPNILFGIREQVQSAGDRTRCADLAEVLAPRRHGLTVSCYGGADLYHDDRLFTPLAGLAHLFRGADGLNLHNGHVHQDALQTVNACCMWNLDTPEQLRPESLGMGALESFLAMRRRPLTVPAIDGDGGILDRVCARRYGPEAGAPMAALCRHGAAAIHPPAAVVWFPITRRLWRGDRLVTPANAAEWSQRLAATRAATRLLESALAAPDAKARDDLEWLAVCLQIGGGFLDILDAACTASAHADADALAACRSRLDALPARCRDAAGSGVTDPLGGDVGAWLPAVELLRAELVTLETDLRDPASAQSRV